MVRASYFVYIQYIIVHAHLIQSSQGHSVLHKFKVPNNLRYTRDPEYRILSINLTY